MTELLEIAVAAARELPPEMQDDMARMMLTFVSEDQSIVELTAEEKASLAESLAQAARGEFATDEQVRAVWAKHGL
jgi:predicted transcriptional regulator